MGDLSAFNLSAVPDEVDISIGERVLRGTPFSVSRNDARNKIYYFNIWSGTPKFRFPFKKRKKGRG